MEIPLQLFNRIPYSGPKLNGFDASNPQFTDSSAPFVKVRLQTGNSAIVPRDWSLVVWSGEFLSAKLDRVPKYTHVPELSGCKNKDVTNWHNLSDLSSLFSSPHPLYTGVLLGLFLQQPKLDVEGQYVKGFSSDH